MTQISTTLSDLVLAAAAVYGILQLTASSWDKYGFAVCGYIIIWIAAVAGMIRFGLNEPPQNIYDVHRGFYWISHTTSVILIAVAALSEVHQHEAALALKLCALATCTSHLFLHGNDDVNFHDFMFFVGIIALGYVTFETRSAYAAVGTGLFLAVRLHKLNQYIESADEYMVYGYLRAIAIVCFARFFTADKSIDDIEFEETAILEP